MTDILFAILIYSCGDPDRAGFGDCVGKEMACVVEGKGYESKTTARDAQKVVGMCVAKVRGEK